MRISYYISSLPRCLCFSCCAESGGKSAGTGSQQNYIASGSAATLFTTRNNTRVIAQRGGLAVLPCAIKWNPAATVNFIYKYREIYIYLSFPAILGYWTRTRLALSLGFLGICKTFRLIIFEASLPIVAHWIYIESCPICISCTQSQSTWRCDGHKSASKCQVKCGLYVCVCVFCVQYNYFKVEI